MVGRKKTRLQLVAEDDIGAEDFCVGLLDDGPLLSGDEPEDLVCGRCGRTLALGLSMRNICAAAAERSGMPRSGTAADGRPFPFLIECDCGAINRAWPFIPA